MKGADFLCDAFRLKNKSCETSHGSDCNIKKYLSHTTGLVFGHSDESEDESDD